MAIAPPIHIDLFMVELYVVHVAQNRRGEGLVQLPKIDVVRVEIGNFQAFPRGRRRTEEHQCRVGRSHRARSYSAPGRKPKIFARLFAANQHSTGAIDDAG